MNAIAAVFAVWWVISACNQFRSGAWTLRLRRYVPLGLIPLWTFFAPNPARADSRLIWREEHGSRWDCWRELHLGFAPAKSRWLVNPELILNKAVVDLVSSLLRVRLEQQDRSALLSSVGSPVLDPIPARSSCNASTEVRVGVHPRTDRARLLSRSGVPRAISSRSGSARTRRRRYAHDIAPRSTEAGTGMVLPPTRSPSHRG